MQMTEQEFKDLMAHFYFLGDKIDPVYQEMEPETSIKGTRIVPLFLLCQNYTRR